MENILSALPSSVMGWIGLTFTAIVALLLAYLAYNRNKDGADDRLINLLKGTVEELEKKVDNQAGDIKSLQTQVTTLESSNATLTKVLQGRDDATLLFQKQVLDGQKDTIVALTRLAEGIEKHMKAIEAQGTKG